MKTARITAALLALATLAPVRADDSQRKDDEPATLEFRRAETEPAEGLVEATIAGTEDEKVYLHPKPDLDQDDVAEAKFSRDANDRPTVEIVFTEKGAEKMKALTTEHRGKPLAVVSRGKVLTAPVIRAVISNRAVISARFTEAEAKRLVEAIGGP